MACGQQDRRRGKGAEMIFRIAGRSRRQRLATRTLAFGIAAAALLLAGCSDLFSIQPLATPETTVFDSALLGVWSSKGGSETRDLHGSLFIRAGAAEQKEYDIVWIPTQGEALRLSGQLVRVGDRLVFDLLAVKEGYWGVPGHFFMLLERSADEISFHWLDSDWLREKVMSANALTHAMFDGKPMIIADSAQINAFLARYGMDPQAASHTATLRQVRQGSAEFVTFGASGAEFPDKNSLEGIWTGDDGGTYQIQQRGQELWWYGHSADGGKHWQNVFHGVMKQPGVYEGKWTDLPPGEVQGSGVLSVRVDGNVLKRTAVTGGFLGSQWQRGGTVGFPRADLGATGGRP